MAENVVSPKKVAGHDAGSPMNARKAVNSDSATLERLPDASLNFVIDLIHALVAQRVPLMHGLANNPGHRSLPANSHLVLARGNARLMAIDNEAEVVED